MSDENKNPLFTPVTSLTYKDPDDGEWKIAEASVDDLAIRLALNTLRPYATRPLYNNTTTIPDPKFSSHGDHMILENFEHGKNKNEPGPGTTCSVVVPPPEEDLRAQVQALTNRVASLEWDHIKKDATPEILNEKRINEMAPQVRKIPMLETALQDMCKDRHEDRESDKAELEQIKRDMARLIELHALRDEAERGTQATERMRLGEGLKSLCDWRKQLTAELEKLKSDLRCHIEAHGLKHEENDLQTIKLLAPIEEGIRILFDWREQMTAQAEKTKADISIMRGQILKDCARLDALEKLHSQGPTTDNVPVAYHASSEACPKPKWDLETYERIDAAELRKELTGLKDRIVESAASKGKTPAETRESILEKADRQLSDAMQCLAVALHAKASMLTPEDRARAEVACPTCHSYTVCPTCRGRPWSEVKKDKQ